MSKINLLLLPLFLLPSLLLAQVEVNDVAPPPMEQNVEVSSRDQSATPEEKVFELFDVGQLPAFPGGERALFTFIADTLHYPAEAKKNNIQGVVVITFVIDKDGSVSDAKVIRDIGAGCGQEGLNVVKAMPKWSPGYVNGHPVKVRYTLPLRFRLE